MHKSELIHVNAAYERVRNGRFRHSEIFSFDVSSQRVASRAHRRRLIRKARLSYALAIVTLALVVLGLFVQVFSLVEIYATNMNIRSLKAENVILSSRVENLASEYLLETQTDTVRTRASEMLGMKRPSSENVYALNIKDNAQAKILASAK